MRITRVRVDASREHEAGRLTNDQAIRAFWRPPASGTTTGPWIEPPGAVRSDSDNKTIVRHFFEEAINQRNHDLLDELVAPDFTIDSAILGEIRGAAAYKQSTRALLNASSDFRATIEDLLVGERDTVITRLTYRGTDTGGFVKGHPATGKPFEFSVIHVWRLANGKLVELSQEADRRRPMQQHGIVPS